MKIAVVTFAVCLIAVTAFVTEEQDKRAKARIIEHHSLHPPHLRQTVGADDIPYWSYSGTTVVTDDYVRLTPDRQSAIGMIWNTEPLDLPAWEMVVGFRVHSKSGFGADGMALWIVDDIPAQKGGLFGHPHEFHGIGILFDSYDNDRYRDNPAVHVLYNPKGQQKDYNAQQDFRGQSVGTCYFDYRNTPKPTLASARIRYHDNTLTVSISKHAERGEVLCATVTDVQLPSGEYFIGFTAETGGISDHHDIHYLHVYPVSGVHYDHDVYEHQPFSHHTEGEQKNYWRSKTPEEEAAEAAERKRQEEAAKSEGEARRLEAEEANKREVERRRVAALEKELDAMRKKAAEQETHYQKLQEQRERHREEQEQLKQGETATQGDRDDAAVEEDTTEQAGEVQPEEVAREEPEPEAEPESLPPQEQKRQQRPRVPLRGQKPLPTRRGGKTTTPPRRK
jgi:lectin, mannose-binding 1